MGVKTLLQVVNAVCHVLGLPGNDLRVARGERKYKQNRLVGSSSIAASSPLALNNLGMESILYHIPFVATSYGSSYSYRREVDHLV